MFSFFLFSCLCLRKLYLPWRNLMGHYTSTALRQNYYVSKINAVIIYYYHQPFTAFTSSTSIITPKLNWKKNNLWTVHCIIPSLNLFPIPPKNYRINLHSYQRFLINSYRPTYLNFFQYSVLISIDQYVSTPSNNVILSATAIPFKLPSPNQSSHLL